MTFPLSLLAYLSLGALLHRWLHGPHGWRWAWPAVIGWPVFVAIDLAVRVVALTRRGQ